MDAWQGTPGRGIHTLQILMQTLIQILIDAGEFFKVAWRFENNGVLKTDRRLKYTVV